MLSFTSDTVYSPIWGFWIVFLGIKKLQTYFVVLSLAHPVSGTSEDEFMCGKLGGELGKQGGLLSWILSKNVIKFAVYNCNYRLYCIWTKHGHQLKKGVSQYANRWTTRRKQRTCDSGYPMVLRKHWNWKDNPRRRLKTSGRYGALHSTIFWFYWKPDSWSNEYLLAKLYGLVIFRVSTEQWPKIQWP